MSNYIAPTYHPLERVTRDAEWLDNYFGPHRYGVRFEADDRVYRPMEVVNPKLDASAKIRMRKSKRQKPVRPTV